MTNNKYAISLYLGALAALPPLSIDMSLPALPALQSTLGATAGQAGMTLSLFLLGFSVAPLFLGPLADRFGRRPVLLGGLVLFTIAGAACALAGSATHLLFWRLIQGIGAGAASVLPMVIIRDLLEGPAARRQISAVTAVTGVAPAIAPVLGTFLLLASSWKGIFAFLAVSGAGLLIVTLLGLREPMTLPKRSLQPAQILKSYAQVIRNPVCLGFALIQAFAFACMFSYVSGAPLILMGVYKLSAGAFSALFACTATSIIAGSIVSGKLAARSPDVTLPLTAGLALMLISALLAALLSATGTITLASLMSLMVINTFSFGLIAPIAWHEALHPLPKVAGVVSAVVGSLQMFVGSLASAAVAILNDGVSSRSLTVIMSVCAVAASIAGFFICRAKRRLTDNLSNHPASDI